MQKTKKQPKYSAYDKKKSKQLLVMCLPAIIKVLIFSYLPLIGLVMAFQNYIPRKGIFNSPGVGFANFEYLLKSSTAVRLIENEVVLNVLIIIFGTVV